MACVCTPSSRAASLVSPVSLLLSLCHGFLSVIALFLFLLHPLSSLPIAPALLLSRSLSPARALSLPHSVHTLCRHAFGRKQESDSRSTRIWQQARVSSLGSLSPPSPPCLPLSLPLSLLFSLSLSPFLSSPSLPPSRSCCSCSLCQSRSLSPSLRPSLSPTFPLH